jgi:hypothetical protein
MGESLTPDVTGVALVELMRAGPATTAPDICLPAPGYGS